MKKHSYILLLFSIAILFSKCEYEFANDYYKEIEITQPTVSLSLINLNENDTLIKPRKIEYNYSAPDKNLLYQINFYVDNNAIYHHSNKTGNFTLEIKNLSNGNHILRIEYIFRLGSESLADLAGYELYKKEENISFNVNNNLPLEIEKVEIVNGSIKIHFKPYALENELFKSITPTLIVESEYGTRQYIMHDYFYIDGVYSDRYSFASKLTYSTKVKNSHTQTTSKKKVFNFPNTFKVDLEIKNNETNIKWTKHPLYNNIKPHIRFKNYNIALDARGGERTIFFVGGFGEIVNYKVNSNSIFQNSDSPVIIEGSATMGSRFDAPKNGFLKIIYSKHNDMFYALSIEPNNQNSSANNVYISELEPQELKTVKKTKITSSTNIYGNLIKNSDNNLVIDLNSKSIVLDINSLSIISEYNISEYASQKNGSIIRFREGTLFIDNTNKNQTIEVFETVSKKKIITLKKENYFGVTNNGMYFFAKHKIYKNKNSIITEVLETPSIYIIKGIDFNLKAKKLYYNRGQTNFLDNNLFEYDINTKATTIATSLPSYIHRFYFSPEEEKIICIQNIYSDQAIYIFDINNNQKKFIKASTLNEVFFINNRLISVNGSYLDNFF